jgi:hypothetical protein
MLKAIQVVTLGCWLLTSTAFSQSPALPGGITIFPTQERTITIYRNGMAVGVHEVPGNVGIFVHADGGVASPSPETDWQFVARGNGEIRLVEFPLPAAPRSPDRLRNAFASAPIVVSFKNSRVTVTSPAPERWQ